MGGGKLSNINLTILVTPKEKKKDRDKSIRCRKLYMNKLLLINEDYLTKFV